MRFRFGTDLAPVLVVAAMFAATPAIGLQTTTLWTDEPPPERFRGDVSAQLITGTPGAVSAICEKSVGKPPPGYVIEACQLERAHKPVIIFPNPCPVQEAYAQLLCHEIGHVNGWPPTHGP